MQKNNFFWDYFMATGNIGAYLIFRKMDCKNQKMFKVIGGGCIRNGVKGYGSI